ncbi:MAG: saccharopine dehydrogenase family protein [Planctomycetes bacterium]|nr:saccharopine dehydrogenase family protein [Planctomycetota bacterium]
MNTSEQKRAVVLGCGLVGSIMARELAKDDRFDVTVADVAEENLARLHDEKSVKTTLVDLGDAKHVRVLVADYDIVLGALPSRIGLEALGAVIDAGKPYCDISFMPQDALSLDDRAKAAGVTAIVDCGVSPGLSNMMVGFADAQLDRVDTAVIYVGGLPKAKTWPFQYKAPFAPSDVLEEYTRPARLVENGAIVIKPALSEPELIELPRAGALEAFNTDGLRSLLTTVKIPNMKEKTLRYPGHVELMRVFRETGLFSKEPVEVNGVTVRPLDVTSKLLFPLWKLEEGEEEFTVLRTVVEGVKDGKRVRYTFDLYDEYCAESNMSSMARTTAFPNVIAATLVATGEFTEPGVFPPELIARRPGLFELFVDRLAARGVHITTRVETLDALND